MKRVLEIPTHQNFIPSDSSAVSHDQHYQSLMHNPPNNNSESIQNRHSVEQPQDSLPIQQSVKHEVGETYTEMQKYHGEPVYSHFSGLAHLY